MNPWDCLSEKDREKIRSMVKHEGMAGITPLDQIASSPLDIETIEDKWKHKEYINAFKIEAKEEKDNGKAAFLEFMMNQKEIAEGAKRAVIEKMMTIYGIDGNEVDGNKILLVPPALQPVAEKVLYPRKSDINIPIELIRKEIRHGK